MIDIECHQCGFSKQVASTLAGRKVQCPKCDAILEVPKEEPGPAGGGRPVPAKARRAPAKRPKPIVEVESYDDEDDLEEEVEVFVPPPRRPKPKPKRPRPARVEDNPYDDEEERPYRPPRELDAPRRKRGKPDSGAVTTVRVYGYIYMALYSLSILANIGFILVNVAINVAENPMVIVGGLVGIVVSSLIPAVMISLGYGLTKKQKAAVIGLFILGGLTLCCGAPAVLIILAGGIAALGAGGGDTSATMGGATLLLTALGLIVLWVAFYGVPIMCASMNMKAFK